MTAVLAGGLVALFAFALATARDWLKDRRTRQRREQAVLRALQGEIASLRPGAENDLALVQHELQQLLPGKRALLNPLNPLGTSFLDLVRIDPPAALIAHEDALPQLRDVARRAQQVDEMIRAREAFRAANQALSGLYDTLEKYDALIERWLSELLEALGRLERLLDGIAPSKEPPKGSDSVSRMP